MLHHNGLLMLKVRRFENNGFICFALSGRIEEQHLLELQALLHGEGEGVVINLDLLEVKLVDREVIRFLTDCEARGIKLNHCPSYVREWMETGRV